MAYAGISLQRISLGALIIALGLLVDDAMIAVEMMVARLEVGDALNKAATYVYTSTAFPMLTGTVVTVIGFIPIAFNASNAGEFTFTLFVVIAVSLLVSWVVAVLFTPLLGVTILPAELKGHHEQKGRVARMFSRALAVCMHHRWITIGVTVVASCSPCSAWDLCSSSSSPHPTAANRSSTSTSSERLDCGNRRADCPVRARAAAGQRRSRPLVELHRNRCSAVHPVI
jgi:multidrug efflux pump subunit AcrB